MLDEGVEPNFVTIASVLPLCARMKNLQHGKEFHCYMMKRGHQFNGHLLLWNSLVEMYSRSFQVLEARNVFDSLNRRDKITYTAMILGYGMISHGDTALKLFEEMPMFNIKPDNVTMVAVLMALGRSVAWDRSRFVKAGKFLFRMRTEVYEINPTVEHYSCMVHLFGMAGHLNKAKKVIMEEMPCSPTSEMWATLIVACQIHRDRVMGKWAEGKLMQNMKLQQFSS
ncbi:hypothetical protein TSUD_167410 [Trifolium subterraneum]|nr:hypothetical protein TSUD_167410 [Trifolium subterraneum]